MRCGYPHVYLSQWALFFSEDGNRTSKDNYRNRDSLGVSRRWQKFHCKFTFGQSICQCCSQDDFCSPTEYSVLLSFSLNTKVILPHNLLYGLFKKWKFVPKPYLKKKALWTPNCFLQQQQLPYLYRHQVVVILGGNGGGENSI